MLEFWRRLQTHYEIKQGASADDRLYVVSQQPYNQPTIDAYVPSCSTDEEELLLRSSAKFESAYLQRAQVRLLEPINSLFPASSRVPPSTEEVEGLTRVIVQEFEQAAQGGIPLSIAVSKIVSKAVQLFAIKCDALVRSFPIIPNINESITHLSLSLSLSLCLSLSDTNHR